jgi:hypothetical protein
VPAEPSAKDPCGVPTATVDTARRAILLTLEGETRFVTAVQVSTIAALFALPPEGLRQKLFAAGRPLEELPEPVPLPPARSMHHDLCLDDLLARTWRGSGRG